jgi:hypothetical protein
MSQEDYPVEFVLDSIESVMAPPKQPKVILFDIGGVCVCDYLPLMMFWRVPCLGTLFHIRTPFRHPFNDPFILPILIVHHRVIFARSLYDLLTSSRLSHHSKAG